MSAIQILAHYPTANHTHCPFIPLFAAAAGCRPAQLPPDSLSLPRWRAPVSFVKACARTAHRHSGTMQGSEDASEPPAAQRRSRQQVRKKLRAAAAGHAFHASALPPGLSAPCCSCMRCPASEESAMLPTTCSPICCTGAVTWAAPPLPAASSAPAGCRGGGSGEWVCVAVRHWQALHSSLGSTFDKSPLAGVFRAGLPACPLPALRYPGLPLPSP